MINQITIDCVLAEADPEALGVYTWPTDEPETGPFFLIEYEVAQCYGGPEEGGWWYDAGTPTGRSFPCPETDDQFTAFARCRALNAAERERAEADEEYGYTSVLSHRSSHYAWDVSSEPVGKPYPEHRPHYE